MFYNFRCVSWIFVKLCRWFFFRFKDFDVSVDEEFDSSSSSSITINHDNSQNEDNISNNNQNVKDKSSEISNSSNRYVHSNGIHFFPSCNVAHSFPFWKLGQQKKTGNIQLPFIGFLFINSLTKREDLYVNDEPPKALPLRPIIRGPYDENSDDDEHAPDTSTVYTEQHTEAKLNCEVDLDIAATVWMHNGQVRF